MRVTGRNLALFFFLYVPATALFGLVSGSFQAPGLDRDLAYELFLWFVVAVQLIVPTFLVFLLVLAMLSFVGRLLPTKQGIVRRGVATAGRLLNVSSSR